MVSTLPPKVGQQIKYFHQVQGNGPKQKDSRIKLTYKSQTLLRRSRHGLLGRINQKDIVET